MLMGATLISKSLITLDKEPPKVLSLLVYSLLAFFLVVTTGHTVTISDRAGGTIYWGGKYVNIKPSMYTDVIGRRSTVDQMDVTLYNDVLTVTVTGPYFYNYAHNIKRTQDAPPGDLYISSRGWKVSGAPPHTKDIFEASEGWDYVVSLQNKKVYKLHFSNIIMTSALPYTTRYRAQQAWRGGYGDYVDEAEVILNDSSLTFVFSVRNMHLESEIGVHWTMKCGNDIIEGVAAVPAIAMTPVAADPAYAELSPAQPADAIAADAIAPDSFPAPVTGAPSPEAFPAGASSGNLAFLAPASGAALLPFAVHSSNSDDDSGGSSGNGGGGVVVPGGVVNPVVNPVVYSEPTVTVPEPSAAILLVAGLSCLISRKRIFRWSTK
jgi:hypothetical protein